MFFPRNVGTPVHNIRTPLPKAVLAVCSFVQCLLAKRIFLQVLGILW